MELEAILKTAVIAFVVVGGAFYSHREFVHQEQYRDLVAQFEDPQFEVESVLAKPIVVGEDTLLDVRGTRRLMTSMNVEGCFDLCMQTVFAKNRRYFRVELEFTTKNVFVPMNVTELPEAEVKQKLLDHDPILYKLLFGPPQIL